MGKELSKLKEKYGDDIPMDELLNLQNEGTKFVNMLDKFDPSSFKQYGAMKEEKILTEDVINKYLEKSNGNPDLAEQMAKKDGYSW